MNNIYVLDNNVLIFLQWCDPHFQFGPIYEWLNGMAQQRRVRIPEVVLGEFKNHERKPWFDSRPHFCMHHDECLFELVNALPDFVDPSKTSEDGDQPLVAAAMSINRELTGTFASGPGIVVSHEQRKKPTSPYLRVPDACDHYQIRCVDFFEMLRTEGVLSI